jgi:hypothetical protein
MIKSTILRNETYKSLTTEAPRPVWLAKPVTLGLVGSGLTITVPGDV